MNDAGQPAAPEASAPTGSPRPEGDERVEALRRRGAPALDPIRFALIEALARRIPTQPGRAGELLEARLAQAIARCGAGLGQMETTLADNLERARSRYPEAAAELEALARAGNAGGLRRRLRALERQHQSRPLAELCQRLAGPSLEQTAASAAAPLPAAAAATAPPPAPTAAAPAELKSLRIFKDSWTRLGLEQQLTQALAQMPENAGPLNSHMLVLRALILMRDTAPDYLHRFMAYLETLLWFEAPESTAPPAKKTAAPAKAAGTKARRKAR